MSWGDKVWNACFDSPFAERGDKILGAVLVAAFFLATGTLMYVDLGAALDAGEPLVQGVVAGEIGGAVAGLFLLAMTTSRRMASARDRARARIAGGLSILSAVALATWVIVLPTLSTEPSAYAGTAGDPYERVYRQRGEVVRREAVSGAQVSVERWAQVAGAGVGAASVVALLALFPLIQGLVGARAERSPMMRTSGADPAWLRVFLGRCASCDRLLLERWRRCPSCGALLPSAYHRRPDTERTLKLVAALGLLAAFCCGIAALLRYDGNLSWDVLLLLGLTGAFAVSHASLPWWSWALAPVRIAWPLLAISAVVLLWPGGWRALLWATLPAAVAFKVGHVGARLSRYVRGAALEVDWAAREVLGRELAGGGCQVCGHRDAEIMAPMWCVSFVVLTVRHPGRPRLVCAYHARLQALPATVVTVLVGWWGIPWGLVWTPVVLWQNTFDGGVSVDLDDALAALRQEEESSLSIPPREIGLVALLLAAALAAAVFR